MDAAQEQHWREFGTYLRQLIEKAGYETLTDFAERAGLTLTHVSRLVNGISGTRRTTMPALVLALNLVRQEEVEALYQKAGFIPPRTSSKVIVVPPHGEGTPLVSDDKTGALAPVSREEELHIIHQKLDLIMERLGIETEQKK